MFAKIESYLHGLRRRLSRSEWAIRHLGLTPSEGTSEAPGLLLIQIDEAAYAALDEETGNKLYAEHFAFMDAAKAAGVAIAYSAELDEARTGRVVRPGGLGTDGPYAEAKEFLAGFWMVDVASGERAIDIPARTSPAPVRPDEPPGAYLGLVVEPHDHAVVIGVEPGHFDVVIVREDQNSRGRKVGEVSRLGVLLGILPKLYSGAHVHHPKVRTARGTSFRFDAAGVETLVDLDGEMVGRLPLEGTVLPQAFRVGTV